MPLPASGNATFDTLSALSVIFDLANGLAEDKSLIAAAFALELAAEAGATEEEQWAAVLASMVRHLGCTAFAHIEAALGGDDIALRASLLEADTSRPVEVLRSVLGNEPLRSWRAAATAVRAITRQGGSLGAVRRAWTAEACGAARVLAGQLAMGPLVGRALDEVFERWDGRGAPLGVAGDGTSLCGRVANTAHTAVLFWLLGGPEHARAVLVRRAGAELDPALARRAERLVRGEAHEYLARQNEALLRLSNARPLGATLGDVAAAFGDFADLQVPEKRGHSRAVARLAHEAARRLGMDEAERETLRLAALVHDIGEVAVPTRVWCVSRAFRPSEAERARTHVYFTERVLASAEPLAAIAPIAAAHHERLDGGGYHRALRASALSMPARVLAAADVFAALREPRPHRPALAFASAVDRIAEMAEGGALDRTAVDAVVGGSASTERPGAPLSHARKTSANAREPDGRAGVTALSARELEVLREVARGRTNKEVAARLGISPRTVQQHTLNIYEKLGVSTRAAAALIAAQCGLLAEG